MEQNKRSWKNWFDPLYFPIWTAIPIEVWLTMKASPYKGVELSLYIIAILFLIFTGTVETSSEEAKERGFGYLYLISALFFASIGLYRWLA